MSFDLAVFRACDPINPMTGRPKMSLVRRCIRRYNFRLAIEVGDEVNLDDSDAIRQG